MSALERTQSGSFRIEDAYTISELEELSYQKRTELVMPPEKLFSDYPEIVLPDFYSRLCHSGCEIYQSKIKTSFDIGQMVRISDKDGFFALGEVREYENGSAIKALKMFKL